MVTYRIKWPGRAVFLNKLGILHTSLHSAGWKGVKDYTKRVFDASQELVPVDTGALKESGRILQKPSTQTSRSTIAYGGKLAQGTNPQPVYVNYAWRIHEFHENKSTGTKKYFVTRPLMQYHDEAFKHIHRNLWQTVKRVLK